MSPIAQVSRRVSGDARNPRTAHAVTACLLGPGTARLTWWPRARGPPGTLTPILCWNYAAHGPACSMLAGPWATLGHVLPPSKCGPPLSLPMVLLACGVRPVSSRLICHRESRMVTRVTLGRLSTVIHSPGLK
ncbi:hypothetical protein Hamer_G023285 [Homarus americanus]|uniref:Uncharacterized protein n=1 Tax=Homarus americanus TaxID=6706 RepID=A0A8J5MS92_HOMAM|nr:hypothetical protein Hamer_G023285 [Homarus americanus]